MRSATTLASNSVAGSLVGTTRITVAGLAAVPIVRQSPILRKTLVAVPRGHVSLARALASYHITTLIVDSSERTASTSCGEQRRHVVNGVQSMDQKYGNQMGKVPSQPSGFSGSKFQKPFLQRSHLRPSTLTLQWQRPDSSPLRTSVLESQIPSSRDPDGSQSQAGQKKTNKTASMAILQGECSKSSTQRVIDFLR